jgi:hypothetical protein
VDLRTIASTHELPSPEPSLHAQSPESLSPSPRPAPPALGGDIELPTLPRGTPSPILSALLVGLRKTSRLLPSREFLGKRVRLRIGGRLDWRLAVIAAMALLAGVALVAITISGNRKNEAAPRLPAGTDSSTASRVEPPLPSGSASVDLVPAAAPAACARTGDAHVIAPNATIAAGIEVRAFGKDVALGFAPNDHQARLVRLDPTSLAVVESTVADSNYAVRRVTPIAGSKGRLALAVDVDRKGDSLRARRTLPVDPPIQVGVADAHLAWAPWNRGVAGQLWPIDRGVEVEALRGAPSESDPSTVAIAFRSAGAVWVGTAAGSGTPVAKGGLFRIEGLGPMVGSPALAINDGAGLMAWADRPSSDDPWRLRWAAFKVGEAPEAPNPFTPPVGGNGEQAMAPALASIPGGRFLLTWTQGATSVHEVRALTLSANGTPLGAPLSISSAGSNAGQGQAVVTSGGRGLVAFLESAADGFQVVVTPVVCSP